MARLPAPSVKVRWILTVLVVAALLGVGFTYYNRLKTEQSELLASIAQSNKTISTFRAVEFSSLESELADLESRARSAESRESSLTQRYRGYAHSIEIQERLYRTAAEANVTIRSLNCGGPARGESGGVTFESYDVSVSAEAEVPPSLLNFLLKVSNYYESGSIVSVNMSMPLPPEEGVSEEKSSLSFTLHVVYIAQEAA